MNTVEHKMKQRDSRQQLKQQDSSSVIGSEGVGANRWIKNDEGRWVRQSTEELTQSQPMQARLNNQDEEVATMAREEDGSMVSDQQLMAVNMDFDQVKASGFKGGTQSLLPASVYPGTAPSSFE